MLLQHYLCGEPVEIQFASDGLEAVAVGRSDEFDLILMDLDMPGRDGYAATKLIRQWQAVHGGGATPIVTLSAHATPQAVRASLNAGCVAHVAKPIERASLLRTIRLYALSKDEGAVCRPASPVLAEGTASLVPVFLASKPRQIEEARASLAQKDFEPIQRFGHNLKGTGGGYGFPEIGEMGNEIEKAALARDEGRITTQLEALSRVVTRELKANEPCR
jgi:CheY-like chemotaxis protein